MGKNVVNISTKSWHNVLDLYTSLLKEMGAPDWHGQSVDALIDSLVYGGINRIGSPCLIRFHDTNGLPNDIIEELKVLKEAIAGARLERQKATGSDVDVELEIL